MTEQAVSTSVTSWAQWREPMFGWWKPQMHVDSGDRLGPLVVLACGAYAEPKPRPVDILLMVRMRFCGGCLQHVARPSFKPPVMASECPGSLSGWHIWTPALDMPGVFYCRHCPGLSGALEIPALPDGGCE